MDPEGQAGGMCIWWSHDVDIQVVGYTRNWIDGIVKNKRGNSQCRCTWMYGVPYLRDKMSFWGDLENFSWNDGNPWLVVGDLNEVIWQAEKEGGADFDFRRRRFLLEFMESNQLVDLGFKGHNFTWEKNCGDVGLVKERLDRGIVNAEWLLRWPNSCVHHLMRIGSDHCPILLECFPELSQGRKLFIFEAFWAKNSECEDLVKECWHDNSLSKIKQWDANLNMCRSKLKFWSKNRFPNGRRQISALSDELSALQNASGSLSTRPRQMEIKGAIEELWRNEEMYWKQRSRVNWLQAGDKNTRFFHLSTIQRRQRNKIHGIKDAQGNWKVREDDIQ